MICSSLIILFILFVLLVLILAFIVSNALSRRKLLLGGSTNNTNNTNTKNIEDIKNIKNIEDIKNIKNTEYIKNIEDIKYYYSIYNGNIGLDYNILKHDLAQYNFHEEPLTKHVHVSFGSLSSKDIYGNDKLHMVNGKLQWWDPLFLQQKAVIKNTLGGHKSLNEKIKLYETIKKLVPIGIKYIPKSYTIIEFELIIDNSIISQNKNRIYILKKNKLNQQKGIRVFSDKREYYEIKKELNIKPHNAIIMEYITNPALTIDDKKFHLRMYVLLSIESGIKRCYIHDKYEILTAGEKYQKNNWLNKKIHISCNSTTSREYKFPNDIANKIDNTKFNEFKKTLAFAISFNDSIIYKENDVGYYIYGVDVLITDDNHFLILEFNSGNSTGHGCPKGIKGTPECDKFEKENSKKYFSFILNSTVFPVFGIKRRPIPMVEVCDHGVLSPFFNILTGANRCILIPYTDASPQEIEGARKIYFHNKYITLAELLKICNLGNIFLIFLTKKQPLRSSTKQHLKKQPLRSDSDVYANDSDAYASGSVIGYLALDSDNYLTIVIVGEYQNRGIATAMVAQFLEIYSHRLKGHQDAKIYMIKKNTFIDKIATKLHFTLNSKGDAYFRLCKIKDAIMDKVNNYKLLTYNVIKENNGFVHDILVENLNTNMVATKSQFVHLAYSEISNEETKFKIIKSSTGSKYDKNFVIQGSELKSVLDLKNMQIKIYKDYVDDVSLYRTYAKYKPYLYNGYRIDLHLFFFLYVSKNGIKKCYFMNDIIVSKSDILFEEELEKNKNYTMHIKNSDVQYKWPDTFLNITEISDMEHKLNLYIDEIANSIIHTDTIPYPESNSGFNVISITVDFTEKENKYVPQIRNLYTYITISGFNDNQYQTQFSRKYYDFLTKNIINSHFGLSDNTTQFAQPLKCIVNTELHVDANIISKLHLTFNKNRDKIEIYLYHGHSKIDKIGKIDLNIDNIDIIVLSHIELDNNYRKKNIAVNVLFVLMEILASYYAPLNISLRMAFVKPMFQIAHTLQFHKTLFTKRRQKDENENKKQEEYYIRLCRI